MNDYIFPKVTQIKGEGSSVISQGFSLAESRAVVFLVGESSTPLTIKVKAFDKEENEKYISFYKRSLNSSQWTKATDSLVVEEQLDAVLILINSNSLAHGDFSHVALEVMTGSEGAVPKSIFAFEIASRYIP